MIELQFATESTLTSDFIRFWTWSRWSHVDLVTPGGKFLGARLNGGVQLRNPGYTKFSNKLQLYVSCSKEVADRIWYYAHKQIGKPYDLTAIMGFAVRRDWANEEAWFCSEFVAFCFQAAGIPLLRALHLNRITPRDLSLSPLLKDNPLCGRPDNGHS